MYKEIADEEKKKGWEQIAKWVLGAESVAQRDSTSQEKQVPTGLKSQSTIGSTTISLREQQWIKNELRYIIGWAFPDIQTRVGNPKMGPTRSASTIVG